MDASLEAYLTRSTEIRRLSMPPKQSDSDATHFYQQFLNNYTRIKALLQENRSMLERSVFQIIRKIPDISIKTADSLMEFSDALADTRTLEMVDLRLAWVIADAMEPFYWLLQQDGTLVHIQKYIHCLFRRQTLAYNVLQMYDRGQITDSLSKTYRDCILECTEKMLPLLNDLSLYARLDAKQQDELLTMELFSATAYERLYYDETLIRKQLQCYKTHIARLTNPDFQAAVPNKDWDFDIFSAYNYLAAVHEFLYWHETPRDILLVLDDAVQRAMAYVETHPDNHRADISYIRSCKRSIDFHLCRIDLQSLIQFYQDQAASCDMQRYDFMSADSNLLPIVFLTWMCREHPDRIPECQDFMQKEQRRTFEYIRGARDQGAYHTLQRFSSYILADYVEVDGGISFHDYYENILIATQPTLYVHCNMTARISRCILDALYQNDPDQLLDCCGCETPEMLAHSIDRLRDYLTQCCFFHDTGKMFFMDTISLYNRMLFPGEFELIKVHPAMGWSVLRNRPSTRLYAEAALYHHKWYDDKGGYPADISYSGVENAIIYQIITCADCIDAATDSVGRTYSSGKTMRDMVADMRSNAGRMFHPALVQLFEDPALYRQVEELITSTREQMYYRVFSQGGTLF